MRYRYSTTEDGKYIKKAVIYTADEHGIKLSDVDPEAVSIIKRLKAHGYDSYIVGGAVRDLILGKKPKDFDIAGAASPAKIKRIFRNSRIIGRRFRLAHVYFDKRIFEVATFRSLKNGNAGNTYGTMEEDVNRRDFTMNALYYDPSRQIVVDYVGGMKDIKKKIVKPIIPLQDIFTDDPVRMIRAVKYAVMSGFTLPMKLKLKITSQADLLAEISPSRLTEEIFKIIYSDKAADIVNMLDKTGLYVFIQPNAAKLMRKNPAFRRNYLKTMEKLAGKESYRGQALGALFSCYLETLSDWKHGSSIDNFKEIYKSARGFVMPMNPPRYEMEIAVKKFLFVRGVTVKKPPLPGTEEKKGAPKRKRRKRKTAGKKKPPAAPQPAPPAGI